MRCIERSRAAKRQQYGFTLIEAIMVVVVMAVLAAFLFPMLHPRRRACRCGWINCVGNQKQIALAYRIWANDHEDRFPWNVKLSEGGTLPDEGIAGRDFGSFPAAFLAISNELTVPKVLVCPADVGRARALTFEPGQAHSFGGADPKNPTAENVSYALGWEADEKHPKSILISDSHGMGTGVGVGTVNHADVREVTGRLHGVGKVEVDQKVVWGKKVHDGSGNVGLADGSVHRTTSSEWADVWADALAERPAGPADGGAGKRLSVRILVGH